MKNSSRGRHWALRVLKRRSGAAFCLFAGACACALLCSGNTADGAALEGRDRSAVANGDKGYAGLIAEAPDPVESNGVKKRPARTKTMRRKTIRRTYKVNANTGKKDLVEEIVVEEGGALGRPADEDMVLVSVDRSHLLVILILIAALISVVLTSSLTRGVFYDREEVICSAGKPMPVLQRPNRVHGNWFYLSHLCL